MFSLYLYVFCRSLCSGWGREPRTSTWPYWLLSLKVRAIVVFYVFVFLISMKFLGLMEILMMNCITVTRESSMNFDLYCRNQCQCPWPAEFGLDLGQSRHSQESHFHLRPGVACKWIIFCLYLMHRFVDV